MALQNSLIDKYGADTIGPYYTSYPTLREWSRDFNGTTFEQGLERFVDSVDPKFALYVHYPFCKILCHFCICNAHETDSKKAMQRALDTVVKDMDYFSSFFEKKKKEPQIKEIHLGGGSPSYLSEEQFDELSSAISSLVDIKKLEDYALEIDPRTVTPDKVKYYATKGIDRISFGIQDFNPAVQNVVNRVQSTELVASLMTPEIRVLYKGVNFDLMYGLPLQTTESFRETIETTIRLSPDRLTLLRYAHIPKERKNMMNIDESQIVGNEEKTIMFLEAVDALKQAGYLHIGIDNFAKPTDELGQAFLEKRIGRNFVGFTPGRVNNNMLGVGASTTHCFGDCYAQTIYNVGKYQSSNVGSQFAIESGHRMSKDDLIRRDAIFAILCNQTLDLRKILDKHNVHEGYFEQELEELRTLEDEGLVKISDSSINVTETGRYYVRHVARTFDRYFRENGYAIKGTQALAKKI